MLHRKILGQKIKRNKNMIKYCSLIWTQESIIRLSVFWPKFGSDEDWVCQVLTEYVTDKSPVSWEEIDYALCWQREHTTLFLLKVPKTKNPKSEEKKSKWEPLDCLPSPYGPKCPDPEPSPTWRPGSPQENSLREGKEIENEGSPSPGTSFSREGNWSNVNRIYKTFPFPPVKINLRPYTLSESFP
jgi:hypothetical protein